MKSSDLVIVLLGLAGLVGFFAWTEDRAFPKDPWYFPLIFALIFSVAKVRDQ